MWYIITEKFIDVYIPFYTDMLHIFMRLVALGIKADGAAILEALHHSKGVESFCIKKQSAYNHEYRGAEILIKELSDVLSRSHTLSCIALPFCPTVSSDVI